MIFQETRNKMATYNDDISFVPRCKRGLTSLAIFILDIDRVHCSCSQSSRHECVGWANPWYHFLCYVHTHVDVFASLSTRI